MSQLSRELFGRGYIVRSDSITIAAGSSTANASAISAPTSPKTRIIIDELWVSIDSAGYVKLNCTSTSGTQLTPRLQFPEASTQHYPDIQLVADDGTAVFVTITLPAAAVATVTCSYWIRYHENRGG